MKNIREMNRADFEALPHRKWDETIICDSIVILPADINILEVVWYRARRFLARHVPSVFKQPEIYDITGMHDSGFRCMDFVACNGDQAICRLSGSSDVINLDGIGGYGYKWLERYHTVPSLIPPSGWNMDCLPTSGLLRLFTGGKILVGISLSSLEIYAIRKNEWLSDGEWS